MRPTSEQIDADIVDAAAGLFALQGVDRTSVQQVADATGYSKTGLLHRFGSKEQLHAAVVEQAVTEVDQLLAVADDLPDGPDRLRALLRLVADAATAHPGKVHYFVVACGPGEQVPTSRRLQERVARVESVFGVDAGDPEQALRTQLALGLVVDGVLVAASSGASLALGDRLAPLLAELAHRVATDPVPAPV